MLPPLFAPASRQTPLRVPTYPAAVTGGPVAIYAPGKRERSVRDSETIFRPTAACPFSAAGALWKGREGLTLLFTVFFCYIPYYSPPWDNCQQLFPGRNRKRGGRKRKQGNDPVLSSGRHCRRGGKAGLSATRTFPMEADCPLPGERFIPFLPPPAPGGATPSRR